MKSVAKTIFKSASLRILHKGIFFQLLCHRIAIAFNIPEDKERNGSNCFDVCLLVILTKATTAFSYGRRDVVTGYIRIDFQSVSSEEEVHVQVTAQHSLSVLVSGVRLRLLTTSYYSVCLFDNCDHSFLRSCRLIEG
jgi:hypothetical protein